VEIFIRDGSGKDSPIEGEIAVANAHPLGAAPFGRDDYVHKFKLLTDRIVSQRESARFLQSATRTADLLPGELDELNLALPDGSLREGGLGIL
jgi:2-methylcitrate dehydratase